MPDYFDSTYQGAYKSGLSLGEGINSAAGSFANNISADKERARKEADLQKNRTQALGILKQFGMINTKTEEPSLEELFTGAKEFAKSKGQDLKINYGDNPEEAKRNIMAIYKALNIPMPKGKSTTELNLSPGTKYDPMKGEVEFSNPKTFLSQIGLDNLPAGMEVTGYDQKGQPMIRKEKGLPPTMQKLKAENLKDIKNTMEINKVQRNKVAEAKSSLENLPSGFMGNMSMKLKRMSGSDEPVMADWQKVKQVLTDDTLLNTARTKGAISDQEMELFKESAANDNLISKPAARVVMDKLINFINAEEKAKIDAYKETFEEDPAAGNATQEPNAEIDVPSVKVNYKQKYGLQ